MELQYDYIKVLHDNVIQSCLIVNYQSYNHSLTTGPHFLVPQDQTIVPSPVLLNKMKIAC